MANMQPLSRRGAAPLAIKYLVNQSARLKLVSVSCSLNKFHSYPKRDDVLNVKQAESLRHLETTHVCKSRHIVNASLCQKDGRSLASQDDRQVSFTYEWKPKNLQKGALFGNRGRDMPICLKFTLGRLTQQLVPVRHYTPKYAIPDNLEPSVFPEEPLGTTFTNYLSEEDAGRVRLLADAEFHWYRIFHHTKMMENIENKPVREFSEEKVFGVPLDHLMKKDIGLKPISPHLKIPSLLCLLLQYVHKNGLNTKGIFKSPESSTKVKELKEDIEANFYKNPNYEIGDKYNAHDVAAALKDFIAELPTPLLTTPTYDFFPDIFSLTSSFKYILEGINIYILMMSPVHRDSLQMLVAALHELTQNSAVNGLTVQDCAEIFAPHLLTFPPDCSEEEAAKHKKQFADLVRVLVHYNDFLFTVPSDVLSKLRNIRRRGAEPDPKGDDTLQPRPLMNLIIHVSMLLTSPEFKGETKKMVIATYTTAREVVEFATGEKLPAESFMDKLKCHVLGKESQALNFLCEVGGNMGERVLDPKTKVIYVWRENSIGWYVVKTWKGYDVKMSVRAKGNIKHGVPTYNIQKGQKDFIIE